MTALEAAGPHPDAAGRLFWDESKGRGTFSSPT